GVNSGDDSGYSVSGAGDVNGDGFADLLVGAFNDDPNGGDSGASFVIFGGINSSATVGSSGADTLTGDSGANQLVAGQGDDTLVGNGGADVLRGGSGDDILAISDTTFSSLDGGAGTDTLRLDAALNLDLSGIANNRLANIEVIDLNRTGSSLSLTTDDIVSIVGDNAANDLIIKGGGSDSLDLSQTALYPSGETTTIDGIDYAIYLAASILNLDESVRVLVEEGLTVSGDLLASVELSTLESSLDNSGFVINGVSAGDSSGWSVSDAGDVNADGLADLLIGAYRDDPNGSLSGASFVVFGQTDGTAVELSAIEAGNGGFVINGASSIDLSGDAVSGAGDVNGDGLADLLVGASQDDPNDSDSGASFVVFGKTDGAVVELSDIEAGSGGFVINGVSSSDRSGQAVSDAGDVNGDGLADLLIGAYKDDPNGESSGAGFVVFGKADGTTVELSDIDEGNGGFAILGGDSGDQNGWSVSSAGDVNGDGLDDLLIGARFNETNGSASGSSYIVFGQTDGTAVEVSDIEAGSGGFAIHGMDSNNASGWSVSGGGDINGDGLADVVIGVPYDDTNGDQSGAAFVVFGQTAGTAVDLSDINNGNGGFVIRGVNPYDYTGMVSLAGDINGDGLEDVLIGSNTKASNHTEHEHSYVVYGKTDGTAVELSDIGDNDNGFEIRGVNSGD
ncbi:MAG: FG-GAP-like repeat-containing protein, partial [Pseudomonadales bacterium]|nr:FG-GAP-like repeat-containing protein [Pseudomonadales bacterium]